MFHILNQICVGDAVVPKPRMSAPASATQKSGIKRGKRPLPMQSVITYDEDGSYHDSADADFQELPTEGQTSRQVGRPRKKPFKLIDTKPPKKLFPRDNQVQYIISVVSAFPERVEDSST
jgi:hypothetical protein